MTAVIRPASQAASISSRLSIYGEKTTKRDRGLSSPESGLTADPNLSIIEVEAILRDKIRSRHDKLQKAFQEYDVNQSLSITQGEFRRILESHCFPMTTEQFQTVMSKVDTNPNGTIRYADFMDKFQCRDSRGGHRAEIKAEKQNSNKNRIGQVHSAGDMNIDMIEKMLRDKLQKNMKAVMKSIRLVDYNRDGHIPKHELRKVLENNCFRLSDLQYNKLCSRFDLQRSGVIDYKDFMMRLGVIVNPQTPDNVKKDETIKQTHSGTALRVHGDNGEKNFDQIEAEFRAKMKSNHENLKRIFLAFDRHLDGFISLTDLRAVLNGFTVPMSEELFSRLMERVGTKGTGKISWELFLDKFQDPQARSNGQTIPLKENHKYNPIRGVDGPLPGKDLFRHLHKHVASAYPSLKQAFLQFDKNRNGKISRKELRRILDSFKLRISKEELKELMIFLDPEHTNFISYHHFLDLFEIRETKEGHKWLKSVHRYNDKQKPAVLAWETVENLMQEKISENWKEISDLIVKCDPRAEGRITHSDLRKIIEQYTLPVSDEHFKNMVKQCDGDEKRVNYVDFMDKLGVDISPGDLMGISTQIHENSIKAENKRLSDHRDRQFEANQHLSERTSGMPVLEVLTRLKDRMSQHNSLIRKAFNSYVRGKSNKISKRDFRKVLKSHGFELSDEHFEELCSQLDFTNGHMTYSDFVANFEDARLAGPAPDLSKLPNHKVNPVRGDEYGMSAIEVESKLRSKLRESFEDLRGAFYKFDDDHNGILTKANFRRMLDTFMLIMTDEEFEKLCQRLGIDKKSKISYTDFLEKFEVRDSLVEGHKWLISDHRYNQTGPVKSMTAEEVHQCLAKKAHRQWKDLAKAFCNIDRNGNGVVTKHDLREVLYKFVLPINREQFNKLWKRYDSENKGYLSHQDFLEKLGGTEFAPGDDSGVSKKIVLQSYANLEDHHRDQQAKHELITLNQATASSSMTIPDLLKKLKDRVRDKYLDFQTAFKKFDSRKRGYLTVNDIQKFLMDFNYFLDDDQFFDLLDRLGLSGTNNRLTYEGFLAAFEEGRKDQYDDQDVDIDSFERSTATDIESKLREKVSSQTDVLQAAFAAFDQKQKGTIPAEDFRRILDNFCFKLTDLHFKQIMLRINVKNGDDLVDYQQFMEMFRQAEILDAEAWLMNQKRFTANTPLPMTLEECSEKLAEAVKENFSDIARAFADVDFARIGVASKHDFSKIVKPYIGKITDSQIDQLWDSLKVNEFGNLDYREFLKKYSQGSPSGHASVMSAASRPHTADPQVFRTESRVSRLDSRISGRFTPLINAESVEKRLRDGICKHWRDIQRQCRVSDTHDTGEISFEDFRAIMRRYPSIPLEADDMEKVLLKYDLRNTNRFCYKDFLRHFVLSMHSQDAEVRGKTKTQKKESDTGAIGSDAVRRVRVCVGNNWKDMRKQFITIDKEGYGLVYPMEFRQVLRNYNINLSEAEFEDVISLCEKDSSEQINYNDFIKKFLKP